jgi:glutathione S-transferase
MIPARYPEGKEGVLGAETEEWMRYKVRSFLNVVTPTLAAQASIERLQLRAFVKGFRILTTLQFLMDYTEGSLFTILIVALITGSKHIIVQGHASIR